MVEQSVIQQKSDGSNPISPLQILLIEIDALLNGAPNRQERYRRMKAKGYVRFDRGCHKDVYNLNSDFVIKVGSVDACSRDHIVYELASLSFHALTLFGHQAQIQERGEKLARTRAQDYEEFLNLRKTLGQVLEDIRWANVMRFSTGVKIIDAKPHRKVV